MSIFDLSIIKLLSRAGIKIMESDQPPHILLVALGVQSHINPALEFAAHLLLSGAFVTLATSVTGLKRMKKSGNNPRGLSFATYSDGYDDETDKPDTDTYMANLKRHGSETLSNLLEAGPTPPYTCVVYTIVLTWVGDVARRHGLPSALLWIQNATLLSIYYHYYNGYSDAFASCDENDPEWTVELPSMPPLHAWDIPSFLTPSNTYMFQIDALEAQFEELKKDQNPIVLVNTFDSLEHEIIESLNKEHGFKVSAIGPLLSGPFLKERKEGELGFRIDLFKVPDVDYVTWLDTKVDSSVVYVSFGSISVLSKTQLEELAEALLDTERPFLWVIRQETEEKLPRWEELQQKGMVVPWCSQVEVLSHRAVGCFVTHCGWNSTLESLAAGMPVVAIPQWTDQLTNAKMLESVWGTGVRVRVKGTTAEEKVVGREEIRRCVEEVMESEETRMKARMWREKAVEAAKEGGSSEVNIKGFVEEVWRMSSTLFDTEQEEL